MRRTILLAALLVPLDALAAPPGQVTVIVRMKSQEDLRRFETLPLPSRRIGVVKALRAASGEGQGRIQARLQQWQAAGQVSRVVPLWIVNGFSVTGTAEAIEALARHADVEEIASDEIAVVPTALPAGPAEPNLSAIGAPDLWSLGHLGQGVVIATLDSGVDVTHPDLAPRYRGGTNSWFDPYGQHPVPFDRTGHGTWTTGVIVGGDAGGTSIGVAPGARFIAARIWNDAGSATATAIHLAFQWVLDPDGDPSTDDAPDVVNNSWSYGTPGCNLAFQADLRALRSAGIVPVFAAGNFGPGAQTSTSPANYPEALSVGSVDDLGAIAADSSRGPSACGGAIFPTVVAPGVTISTSDLYSYFRSVSGTSIAAPHVSGLLALLLGAYSGTSGAEAEAALVGTARDLGAAGPDADFGHGMVDGLRAFDALASAPPPPPPPPPTAPTAAGDSFALAENATLVVAAPGVLGNDSDPGGKPLAAVLLGTPQNGAVSLRPDGSFVYTPRANFYGVDGFTYQATNGTTGSAPATVSLTITFVNQPPVARDDAATTARGVAVNVAVLANDVDLDGSLVASSVSIKTSPKHGSVSRKSNGTVTYTPNRIFRGTDTFKYTVKDDHGATSNVATVTVQVVDGALIQTASRSFRGNGSSRYAGRIDSGSGPGAAGVPARGE